MTHPIPEALAALIGAIAATGYEFVPPTPESHRRVNSRPGNAEARSIRDIFGWSRPFRREIAGDTIFHLLERADALEPVGALWRSKLRVATLDGRYFLHSAYPTVAPNSVFFGPDTYRFVRAALAVLPERHYARAVDLGCGSGAGGVSVAARRDIGELFLTDINPTALTLTEINARQAGQPARCLESDLFDALDGMFDLILANPPYLADPHRRAYRDGGGPLGLDLGYRILREGLTRLAPGGILFLYTGVPIIDGIDPIAAFAAATIPDAGFRFSYGEIDPDVFGDELERRDYGGVDRIAAVGLTVFRTIGRA